MGNNIRICKGKKLRNTPTVALLDLAKFTECTAKQFKQPPGDPNASHSSFLVFNRSALKISRAGREPPRKAVEPDQIFAEAFQVFPALAT